jgi:hypothetical protein
VRPFFYSLLNLLSSPIWRRSPSGTLGLALYGEVRLPVEKSTLFVNLVCGFEVMHGVGRGCCLLLSFIALSESTLSFCCIYRFI